MLVGALVWCTIGTNGVQLTESHEVYQTEAAGKIAAVHEPNRSLDRGVRTGMPKTGLRR